MNERSLLLVGACTISGLGLPGTLSLPVLISRAFRNQNEFRLRIESENHIDNLVQLLELLKAGRFAGPYDVIVLQSMIGRETIPQLGMGARMDHPGLLGDFYRWLRRLDFTPQGHRMINHLRALVGKQKSSSGHYEQTLNSCLEAFRHASPAVKIIVLGQGPPMSSIRSAFTGVCEQNRLLLQQMAEKHAFDYIDLHPLLTPFAVDEVYQEDGLHFTAQGQRLVAEAIIARIKADGVV